MTFDGSDESCGRRKVDAIEVGRERGNPIEDVDGEDVCVGRLGVDFRWNDLNVVGGECRRRSPVPPLIVLFGVEFLRFLVSATNEETVRYGAVIVVTRIACLSNNLLFICCGRKLRIVSNDREGDVAGTDGVGETTRELRLDELIPNGRLFGSGDGWCEATDSVRSVVDSTLQSSL
jgi:hypothetical protein